MKQILLCLLTLCLSAPALAAEKLDTTYFNQIPILENGRVKPLGAFAKHRLKSLSGHEHLKNQNASEFLAEALFNPAIAIQTPVFSIKNKDLKDRLSLPAEKDTFTLQDLSPGIAITRQDVAALLEIDQNDLTKNQKDLLDLHEKSLAYTQLLRSFSMVLPLNIDVPGKYAKELGTYNYLDLQPLEQRITKDLKTITRAKGDAIENYSNQEKSIALLGFQLQQIRQGGQFNTELRIIPIDWSQNAWAAPWELLSGGQASPQTKAYLEEWQKLADAYRSGDSDSWRAQSKTVLETAQKLADDAANPARLKTELLYQSVKPYHVAMALYVLSILLFTIAYFKPKLIAPAYTAGILALLLHTAAIAARVFILERPPVGTLYESILFVSAIAALSGLIIAIKNKNPLFALISQIAALALLVIAPTMLQQNDSLELLVAVLNTNFWLTVHVLCITSGYAVCILAALIAHTYMALRIKDKTNAALPKLHRAAYKTSLIALLLTAVGTALGGIWADQSWGRFWGWDPKENGALLIVLWLIWIQHGRISGHMRDLPFMAAIAALNIIVALAWFGVNLLGVGLHSYGFTSGIAAGLLIFCTAETIIILGLWSAARLKERTVKP